MQKRIGIAFLLVVSACLLATAGVASANSIWLHGTGWDPGTTTNKGWTNRTSVEVVVKYTYSPTSLRLSVDGGAWGPWVEPEHRYDIYTTLVQIEPVEGFHTVKAQFSSGTVATARVRYDVTPPVWTVKLRPKVCSPKQAPRLTMQVSDDVSPDVYFSAEIWGKNRWIGWSSFDCRWGRSPCTKSGPMLYYRHLKNGRRFPKGKYSFEVATRDRAGNVKAKTLSFTVK